MADESHPEAHTPKPDVSSGGPWFRSLPTLLGSLAALLTAITALVTATSNSDLVKALIGVKTETKMNAPAAAPEPPVILAQQPVQSTPERKADASRPFFLDRVITDNDVAGKSRAELDLMRNEIFARAGRKFKRGDLDAYFRAQNWYRPTYEADAFSESLLSDAQRQNIRILSEYSAKAAR